MKFKFFLLISALLVGCYNPASQQQSSNEGKPKQDSLLTTAPRSGLVSEGDLTKVPWLCIPGKQVGMIMASSTEADIIDAYGADNVARREVGVGERSTAPGTIVFPDSANELVIYWQADAPYEKLDRIRVDNDDASWKTGEGISIGTSIERLNEVNGKEFEFYGFEWDYAGLADNWNGGELSEFFHVYLTPSKLEAVMPDLLGERKFLSTHPKAEEGELKVSSMVFLFNQDEGEEESN